VGAVITVEEWNYRFEEMEFLGFTDKTLGPVQLEETLGRELWASWPASLQLAFMGGTQLPEEVRLRPKKLYVLQSGPTCLRAECLVKGMDYDPYGNKTLTDTPLTQEGTLFAFATGEQIMEQTVRVSVLTTALFHYASNFSSDKLIMDELNAVAPKLVADTNRDGVADYSDVLNWSRQRHAAQYLGDEAALDRLTDKIRDHDDYYFRSSWIDVVGSEGARMLVGQDYVSSIDGVDGYQSADAKTYGTDGVPDPHTRDKALWLGERPKEQKIYSIEWWGYYGFEDLPEDTESLFFVLGLYQGDESGVPGSRILEKKIRAHVAPNPDDRYQDTRVSSTYSDYDGRLIYRYNAVLTEPLLLPLHARWLAIAQLGVDSGEFNPNFVLLASRAGDTDVSFSTHYGWITPSYDRPRRSAPKGYLRLRGMDLE
jgi:hypothetical protein